MSTKGDLQSKTLKGGGRRYLALTHLIVLLGRKARVPISSSLEKVR